MTTHTHGPTLRIEALDPATLDELRKAFPTLEQEAILETEDTPVGEDRELGTIILIINLSIAGINLATAVLNYLAQKQKGQTIQKE